MNVEQEHKNNWIFCHTKHQLGGATSGTSLTAQYTATNTTGLMNGLPYTIPASPLSSIKYESSPFVMPQTGLNAGVIYWNAFLSAPSTALTASRVTNYYDITVTATNSSGSISTIYRIRPLYGQWATAIYNSDAYTGSTPDNPIDLGTITAGSAIDAIEGMNKTFAITGNSSSSGDANRLFVLSSVNKNGTLEPLPSGATTCLTVSGFLSANTVRKGACISNVVNFSGFKLTGSTTSATKIGTTSAVSAGSYILGLTINSQTTTQAGSSSEIFFKVVVQ